MSKGKRIEAEMLLERITKYNNLWSREPCSKVPASESQKPDKPTRRTRHDEPDDRSIDETDNLLSVTRIKPESSASAATSTFSFIYSGMFKSERERERVFQLFIAPLPHIPE